MHEESGLKKKIFTNVVTIDLPLGIEVDMTTYER